jgi:hypothetical protein
MSNRSIFPIPPVMPESTDAVKNLKIIKLQRKRNRLERLTKKKRLREDIVRLRKEANNILEPVNSINNRTSIALISPSL